MRKYIDINSDNRNRTQYPSPNNFVIPFNSRESKNSINTSDYIIDSYPYDSGTLVAGSTAILLNLALTSSSVDDFYVGSVVEIPSNGDFSTVTAYNGTTKIATVSPALLSGAPGAATYNVRFKMPAESSTFQLSPSATTLILNVGASTIDDYYNGKYINIINGPGAGDLRLVTDYVGSTRTATVVSIINVSGGAPADGNDYEIMSFSRANDSGMIYSGSVWGKSQYVNYEIELTSLIIPRLPVTNTGAGDIISYPFVYVEFGNLNNISNTMYSNSPHSRNCLFKVPINDNHESFSFLNLTCNMKQVIKYKPDTSHVFIVRLPNGEVLNYGDDDMAPLQPNRYLQTSATFCIRQLRGR